MTFLDFRTHDRLNAIMGRWSQHNILLAVTAWHLRHAVNGWLDGMASETLANLRLRHVTVAMWFITSLNACEMLRDTCVLVAESHLRVRSTDASSSDICQYSGCRRWQEQSFIWCSDELRHEKQPSTFKPVDHNLNARKTRHYSATNFSRVLCVCQL